MGASVPALATIVAFGDSIKKGFEDITGISGQKKLAADSRNEQMRAQAEAEAQLKEQELKSSAELTQKKRRVKAMSKSTQEGTTGREGTVLGSATAAPVASNQIKTLLGE